MFLWITPTYSQPEPPIGSFDSFPWIYRGQILVAIFHGFVNLEGRMEFYDFPYIGNVIIPTDELIFFRGVGIPPTRG